MILVGDSGGMVQLGYQTTNPVTMDEMILMAKSAKRGAPDTFLVGDMPQGSYEASNVLAVENALRFVKEAGCDAVKLEGGKRMVPRVKAIYDAGILVMGHIGLTPQSSAAFGGYRIQGKSVESFEANMEDALALQASGACAILVEAIPEEVSAVFARKLSIPILGIGAGKQVDGQLLIVHDVLGLYPSFRPTFAKCYIPLVIEQFSKHLGKSSDLTKLGRDTREDGISYLAELAITRYVEEVKELKYPSTEYRYPLSADILEMLKKSKYWNR